jgi:uncharacterized protein (TIGR02301 family)
MGWGAKLGLETMAGLEILRKKLVVTLILVGTGALCAASEAHAAAPENKPYDEKLVRLAEILGAVHYLRELCSSNEGQYWRERMQEILSAEGTTALRRARLTRSFNQGYRSYSRTYLTCTPSAQTAITRFMSEGVQISEGLLKSTP